MCHCQSSWQYCLNGNQYTKGNYPVIKVFFSLRNGFCLWGSDTLGNFFHDLFIGSQPLWLFCCLTLHQTLSIGIYSEREKFAPKEQIFPIWRRPLLKTWQRHFLQSCLPWNYPFFLRKEIAGFIKRKAEVVSLFVKMAENLPDGLIFILRNQKLPTIKTPVEQHSEICAAAQCQLIRN